jgi:hypothetical protein
VDTQGHELQVLQGAERLLSHYGIELLVLEFAPKLLMANGVDPALLLHYLYVSLVKQVAAVFVLLY